MEKKEEKIIRKPEPEDKKNYFKMKNQGRTSIRWTPEERARLEEMMQEDGWENLSGFIKFKVFGTYDIEDKVKSLIDKKDTTFIVLLMKNMTLDIAAHYEYFLERYRKDMNQLWKEEGVNFKKWISATNRWMAEMTKVLQEYLYLQRRIADALGLREYFVLPSDSMKLDLDNPSQEEYEKIARQMHTEQIMMGRISKD